MYAKCGHMAEAEAVFHGLDGKSVVSWTSLVVGLAINGFGEDAIRVFEEMERRNVIPTEITFIGVLYACSHNGLVDEGFAYLEKMIEKYGIVPRMEHYGCMVDLMGRAGKIERAYDYIKNMPVEPNAVIWRTLLGACTLSGNVRIGEVARKEIVKLEPKHCGDYVLLSNLYASERRWCDVDRVRRAMVREGVRKVPGYSLVEVRNTSHEFVMGDKSHPRTEEIYEMLREMRRRLRSEEGYDPGTSGVLTDVEEEEKEDAVMHHSEKIAVAFGLISTPPGSPIRVVKNLRICVDCHVAIKMVSRVFRREIVVRDCSRFHHFRDGNCTCKDYWTQLMLRQIPETRARRLAPQITQKEPANRSQTQQTSPQAQPKFAANPSAQHQRREKTVASGDTSNWNHQRRNKATTHPKMSVRCSPNAA
ncbi:Pentatricopeptide repeat-containing protein [Striga hermonthica]|uniref:Pentatricopeptide repeat-containing protein n=1 Tax=Striga hermonthica TaxID=68872 RepID=A0A9N7NGC6_STRHE|nr:Pentatricopeptide repeat-containing protein [Striga hermonthica]